MASEMRGTFGWHQRIEERNKKSGGGKEETNQKKKRNKTLQENENELRRH